MKNVLLVCRRAILAIVAMCPVLGLACDSIPAGQTLWIRLNTPVSTYTAKPGDTVSAVLTEAVECDNEVVLPIGTNVTGVVRTVRKVGWGILHETAALKLQFVRATPEFGDPIAIPGEVMEVENAREQVSKGTIQGIRSSDSPQGRINSRLRHLPTWNPYSDVGLIVFKASFPIFPEPEIYLPAGTDIKVKVTQPVTFVSSAAMQAPPSEDMTGAGLEVESEAGSLPTRTTTQSMVQADVVNLAFIGSRAQIQDAFHKAGWVNSDVFTRHSFMRDFYAFLNNSGYPQAPMRPFLLDGQPAEMSWEKSLNSYARRDHLRMWEWPSAESGTQQIWLSSATHDTGAALSVKHHEFVHHISPDVDGERSKVIRDLAAAGCVQSVHMVSRPGMATFTQNDTGDPVRTDGSIAVVELKQCQAAVPELASVAPAENFKAGNHAFRYFRRQILTFRSDIWRANIIYGVYDLGHMSVTAIRHRSAAQAVYTAAKQEPNQQPAASARSSETTTSPEALSSYGFR